MGFFLVLIKMLPAIIEVIKKVEEVIPEKGKGPMKLDLILNTVNAAANASPEIAASVEGHDLNGALTSMVNATVNTLNAAGVFNK